MSKVKDHKLMDEFHDVMRLHHYLIHTERSYCDWIKHFVHCHKMTGRKDSKNGEIKIKAFLTHQAVNKDVSASTQNQAMNALVFLYKHVLRQPLNKEINAVRVPRKKNVPIVKTCEEVAQVISLMEGILQIVVKLLYNSGLRIIEAVRLRVHEIDFTMKQITVRLGKGDKDSITTFPESVIPLLQNHLIRAINLSPTRLGSRIWKSVFTACVVTKCPLKDKNQLKYTLISKFSLQNKLDKDNFI